MNVMMPCKDRGVRVWTLTSSPVRERGSGIQGQAIGRFYLMYVDVHMYSVDPEETHLRLVT